MFWGKAFINPHSSMAWANMMERACFYREPCFPCALLIFSSFDPFIQKAADDESQKRKQKTTCTYPPGKNGPPD